MSTTPFAGMTRTGSGGRHLRGALSAHSDQWAPASLPSNLPPCRALTTVLALTGVGLIIVGIVAVVDAILQLVRSARPGPEAGDFMEKLVAHTRRVDGSTLVQVGILQADGRVLIAEAARGMTTRFDPAIYGVKK